MKNITILSSRVGGEGIINVNELEEGSREVGDDLRPHQQCPRETEDNGHRF